MKRLIAALCFLLVSLTVMSQDSINLHTPFVLGRINEINSKVLSEKRILNIYLPAGYNENDTIKYPVIYLLDGSADEDFIHIAGLVQFANFPWVNFLPRSIVVGIANVDRQRDLTYPTTIEKDRKDFPTTGGSAKFISFIETELQPFIDKNYKTSASRMIIGQSLGGLLATEILFKHPGLFTQYVIVSPSLWWDHESLLSIKPRKAAYPLPSVYVAVGKEGAVMEKDARRLAALIRNSALVAHLKFQYFVTENHGTILHKAVYQAFESFNSLKK